jgi:hypothetical protein
VNYPPSDKGGDDESVIALFRPGIVLLLSERVAGIEPALQPWKGRAQPLRHTRLPVLSRDASLVCANAVTVSANDIALRDLGQQRCMCASATPADHELLRGWVEVIELHHAWWESSAAVCARNVAELVEHRRARAPMSAFAFEVP